MPGLRAHRNTIAVACFTSISLVVLATSGSPIPMVPLSKLGVVDDGTTVCIVGLVADLWSWDDGTENILLVEICSVCTVRVVCSRAVRPLPGSYVHLGDEIEVVGEVFGTHSSRKIYSDSDRVALLRQCKSVLTVDALSECWTLFEDDEIEVRGILLRGANGIGFALRGLSSEGTVALEASAATDPSLLGREVVAAGYLRFEESSMAVVLHADSIRLFG